MGRTGEGGKKSLQRVGTGLNFHLGRGLEQEPHLPPRPWAQWQALDLEEQSLPGVRRPVPQRESAPQEQGPLMPILGTRTG